MSEQFRKPNLGRVKRVALYARYSNHMQRHFATEDQMRACATTAADARRMRASERSKSSPGRRTGQTDRQGGFHEILALARKGWCPSDVIVSDTSRLGRNLLGASDVSEIEISEIVQRYSRWGPRRKGNKLLG